MSKEWEFLEVLWENRMVTDAEDRYLKRIEDKEVVETKLGEKLLEEIAIPVSEVIKKRQQQASETLLNNVGGGKRLPWVYLIPLADSQNGAFAVVQTLMNSLSTSKPPTYQHLAIELGETWVRQIRFERWLDKDSYASKFLRDNRQALAARAQKLRFTRKLEKKIAGYLDQDDYELTRDGMFGVGALILDCIKQAYPEMLSFTATTSNGKLRAQTIYWSDDFLTDVSRLHAIASVSQPIRRPMIVPPRDWKRGADGKIEGGYYFIKQKIYRVEWHPHRFDPSDEALESLNTIQRTPWRISESVHGYLKRNPSTGPELPSFKPMKVPAAIWESLSLDDKRVAQQQFNDDLANYVSQSSKAMTFERQLLQAEMLEGKTFWQPHAFDFRGRLYPSNQMLTSQGDDVAKALIEFANGKRLGAGGLRALKIHCANTYGFDKLELDARVAAIDEMLPAISRIENDIIAKTLIDDADDGMSFYAAAVELCRALKCEDPETYVSHLPIAVDGTCNGLQILSLLGKDSVGALKTNCTDAPTRRDLYQEVAKAVNDIIKSIIKRDTPSLELEVAKSWYEVMQNQDVARKVVKRAVMTTAYGVTSEGIREQLVKDRRCDDLRLPAELKDLPVMRARHRMASFMRDWILEGRVSVVSEALKIMDYLRDTAKALAEQGYPLSWVTPDGCEISQRYVHLQDKPVRTFDNWMRRLRKRTDRLTAHKMAGAASPNVVHSLDAAMLRMVARRLAESGITDMAFVHDSYAVHANHLEELNRVIREVAVEMFEGDWLLDSFHEGLKWLVEGTIELPVPPKQGQLDIGTELKNAVYFFS